MAREAIWGAGPGLACELKCLMAAMSLCLADARLIGGCTGRAKGRTPPANDAGWDPACTRPPPQTNAKLSYDQERVDEVRSPAQYHMSLPRRAGLRRNAAGCGCSGRTDSGA